MLYLFLQNLNVSHIISFFMKKGQLSGESFKMAYFYESSCKFSLSKTETYFKPFYSSAKGKISILKMFLRVFGPNSTAQM